MEPLDALVERVCARVAPTWPLDRFIAVNPFWGLVDRSIEDVSKELCALSGTRLLLPRAWYREARAEGRLRDAHLRAAIEEAGATVSVSDLVSLMDAEEPRPMRRARVMDAVDTLHDVAHEMSFRDLVIHETSQLCASYFDDGQAQLGPDREGGLYATFRRHAISDRSPGLLLRMRDFRSIARELPADARAMVRRALDDIDVPEGERETYLASLLLDVNGWAAWCAYLRFQARLTGGDDPALSDLLAIRLAWEWLLLRAGGRPAARRFQIAMAGWSEADRTARASLARDWLLQSAVEIAYRETVTSDLVEGLRAERPTGILVQAVFCIDVRSEPMRRALEARSPAVQTLGFAGFFGLPAEHRPLGADVATPHLPGLLAPDLTITDTGAPEGAAQRVREARDRGAGMRGFKTGAVSTFAFVEALGLSFLADLVKDSLGLATTVEPKRLGKPRVTRRATGEPLSAEERADIAAGVLRTMSLTHDFGRIVLLVGHSGETRNNPHSAGLDCGACGGRSGEVSARAAAALLNEPDVRRGLSRRGIDVPETTRFLAGLHNTTTDEITLFETEDVPASHAGDLERLRAMLAAASDEAREERARKIGVDASESGSRRQAFSARARDWSEVRPELGLADNAALVIAPRERTRHMNLSGRAFLHEYRADEDDGAAVLERIFAGPLVVANWINMAYYASAVDNARYGSGNKVLHNVVGGHIGVFEGNGGDLRIGLPFQSIHDGRRLLHTPLRLAVFVEADLPAIEGVLRRQPKVRALVRNGWIHLLRIDRNAEDPGAKGAVVRVTAPAEASDEPEAPGGSAA